MLSRLLFLLALLPLLLPTPTQACCPVAKGLQPVINADQTVIILWDAKTKTQHFIRQASFESPSDDVGFIIPTPSQPQLSESGDSAFALLDQITERPIVNKPTPWTMPGGCAMAPRDEAAEVRVLEEKRVAGFDAVVLEADTSGVLKTWLTDHGYAFSPQVQAWAEPYIAAGWKFTAMKIAKDPATGKSETLAASALRLSFKTDRPLFPYREPDPAPAASAIGRYHRLLKIYFIAEARYQGELTPQHPWTGHTTWAKGLSPGELKDITTKLKLPENTGPQNAWLTVFEDSWPYRSAPADLYFSPEATQMFVAPQPRIRYVSNPINVTTLAVLATLALLPLVRMIRNRNPDSSP
jgi:hypothetical protein